jgi:hypothetical protein
MVAQSGQHFDVNEAHVRLTVLDAALRVGESHGRLDRCTCFVPPPSAQERSHERRARKHEQRRDPHANIDGRLGLADGNRDITSVEAHMSNVAAQVLRPTMPSAERP